MTSRVENMTAFRGTRIGILPVPHQRIGILTIPRQRIELTADSVRLQRGLLRKTRPHVRHDVIVMSACVAASVFVMAMAWAGWLP